MPATRYSQYFNIDEKYYAVVTRELIDEGKVKWEGFYPHETFIQLLHQVVDMLSGKEEKSIWVEGSYGTGKSHASLTIKCLLEAGEDEVRAYFKDYGLSDDLCNSFLAARSEQINGKLIVVHRIGSSNIKGDDDLIWAVQDSITRAMQDAGVENLAAGTMKDALIDWVREKPANRNYLASLIAEDPFAFGGKNLDAVLELLCSDDDKSIEALMEQLMVLCRRNGILAMNMDAGKLSHWIADLIEINHLGAIMFIWDEFSEYFRNCNGAITGFQTLAELSLNKPFYFMIVTHQSEGLITDQKDRRKLSDRFMDPHVHIKLPDNMAFRLMQQAMKETEDPVMRREWAQVKMALNNRLGSVRARITDSAKRRAKAGEKTVLKDEDLQGIVPLHPYAALALKHISFLFTSSQRSMFDFIVARDPDADGKADDNALVCRAFKWYINHNSVMGPDILMTVDMLWDFFNAKSGGNMNPDALEILNNFEMLNGEYRLNPDEQRVLKTVLLMNAICTQVQDADMLVPTYDNIDLAFAGTGWDVGKAQNIAKALVHREAPLQPVLFEEPMQDGKSMRVIPKKGGGEGIDPIKERIRNSLKTSDLVEKAGMAQTLRVPDNLAGHFTVSMLYVNPANSFSFTRSLKDVRLRAQSQPDHFELCILTAKTDAERTEVGKQIQTCMREGVSENLLLLDASTNTFETYLENYITNLAYSEYYAKSDKRQSNQFAAYAQKNLSSWKEQVAGGEFRLYDMQHKNGQQRVSYAHLTELLQELNRGMYPFGIEQYQVNPTMFTRSAMGQGAECGIRQEEKGSFTSGNPATRLSTALSGAWKVEGRYWEDVSRQNLVIVRLKQRVEEIIAAAFEQHGEVRIIDIVSGLQERPFGLTPNNLSAFVLGFLLKEYANDQYFWSNGATRPMSVELMKSAIKNAMDQIAQPKANYRVEKIVTMSGELRLFLKATATIFHENPERCGSVDAAAGVIRLGMKRLEFPIWCLKSLLDREQLQTDPGIIAEVIDRYIGIANIRNYPVKTTESDLAREIGELLAQYAGLQADLDALLCSQKCREGMKAYLDAYSGGELPALAMKIKDGGAYVAEVKKKFNADEANWVWAAETANAKIDEVIIEYSIIAESNTIIAQSNSMAGCVRAWRDRIGNFRLSLDAMAAETAELKGLLDILYALRQSKENAFPDMKKKTFLDLLRTKKGEFNYLYSHQEEMFRRIAQGWLSELSDEDISELFESMDSGVFCDASDKYFTMVEARVKQFMDKQRSARLTKLWRERTHSSNPSDWSRYHRTPILCMFADHERQQAKEIFSILQRNRPSEADYARAKEWLESGTFYDRLESAQDRDRCMRERVIGDYSVMLSDVDVVRDYLSDKAASIPAYEWMDNSTIQGKIRDMANMKYKTGGSTRAEQAVAELSMDELREYVRNLIRTDMSVGIAILKKQQH